MSGVAMIRFPVFMVVGPLIGCFVFMVLGGGIRGASSGIIFGMLLLAAWIAGLIPAAITATLDQLFERLGARPANRYLLTGISGYATAYLFMLENYFEIEPLFPLRYDWGLVGAIPAIICSFVTAKLEIPTER
jgi:hypothetical protein